MSPWVGEPVNIYLMKEGIAFLNVLCTEIALFCHTIMANQAYK